METYPKLYNNILLNRYCKESGFQSKVPQRISICVYLQFERQSQKSIKNVKSFPKLYFSKIEE